MNIDFPQRFRRLIHGWSVLRTGGIRVLPPKSVAILYLVTISVAELLTTFSTPQVGLALHALLFMLLLAHAAMLEKHNEQAFLFALSLAPLIRLVSLSMPLTELPFVYWYMIVGAPLFVAAIITIRVAGLDASTLGLNLGWLPTQMLVALSGILLGFIEYLILRPAPLIPDLRMEDFWLPAVILLVFTGFLEELIFRGLMQHTSVRYLGRFGLIFVPLVFAALHIGYRSFSDVYFVFLAATFFTLVVWRTGSLLGVSLSHGLTNITLFLIFPIIFAAPIHSTALEQPTASRSSIEGMAITQTERPDRLLIASRPVFLLSWSTSTSPRSTATRIPSDRLSKPLTMITLNQPDQALTSNLSPPSIHR